MLGSCFIHPPGQQSRDPQDMLQNLGGDQTRCLVDPGPCLSLNELVCVRTRCVSNTKQNKVQTQKMSCFFEDEATRCSI